MSHRTSVARSTRRERGAVSIEFLGTATLLLAAPRAAARAAARQALQPAALRSRCGYLA